MRTQITILPVLICLLCGCAHEHFTKGHGDVGQFILDHAIVFGGHPTTTNGLPMIKGTWRYSEDDRGLEIHLLRQQYPAGEAFLRQALGAPQFGPVDTNDGCKLGVYRLTPKGGGITFSYDARNTLVLMLRPVLMPPKPEGASR